MREAGVSSQAMALVGALPRVVFGRNNTGALPDEGGRLVRYGLGHTRKGTGGSPDYVGCVGGLFVGLEMKGGRHGRLSDDQRRWHRAWSACGALVAVVREPQQALAVVQAAAARADWMLAAADHCAHHNRATWDRMVQKWDTWDRLAREAGLAPRTGVME